METTNFKVSIKDPETGEMKEIPFGDITISMLKPEKHEDPPQGDGHYSFSARIKVKRKDRRKFDAFTRLINIPTDYLRAQRLLRQAIKFLDLRDKVEPKNPNLAEYYQHIADLKNKRSEFYLNRWFEASKKWKEEHRGGIVPGSPNWEDHINRGETVFKKEDLARMFETPVELLDGIKD